MKNKRRIHYGHLDGSTLKMMSDNKSDALLAATAYGRAVKLLPNGWIVGMKNEYIGLAWK